MALQGTKLQGIKKESYIVGNFINRGGEGDVYQVAGDSRLVIKIYNEKKMVSTQYVSDMRTHLERKLKIMVEHPVQYYNSQKRVCIAWPLDVVYENGKFVGYVMPCVTTNKKIYDVCRENSRTQMFPDYTWQYGITIASNLAWTVNKVHKAGYCIGDFNSNNILVDTYGNVTLIDTDSFDIIEHQSGISYKCMVGVPEMLAPELQGRGNLQNPKVKFTKYTDYFSLSIHIFNLLMNNCHPFNCINIATSRSSTNNAPVSLDIAEGHFYYGKQLPKGIELPKSAPDYQMLPDYIRDLFNRTFCYTAQTALTLKSKRASAEEWYWALDRLSKEDFFVCNRDRHHVYLKQYPKCPWCDVMNASSLHNLAGRAPFNVKNRHISSKTTSRSTYMGAIRRKTIPLYITYLLVGIVAGIILAPLLQYILNKNGVTFKLQTLQIISGSIGAVEGPLLAHFFEERYVSSNRGWPWLLASLLTIFAIALTAVVVGLVVFIAIVVFYIIVAVFVIFCCCSLMEGA